MKPIKKDLPLAHIIHKGLTFERWFRFSLDEQLANVGAEIGRTIVRFLLLDHFMYENKYNSTDEYWDNYFYQFNYAAAIARGK